MADLVLARFGSDDVRDLDGELAAVYAGARSDQAHNPFYSRERFLERLDMYLPAKGFEVVTGRIDGVMVGFAFGNPRANAAEIWNSVRSALPDIPAPETPAPVYVLRELNVLPEFQLRGHGRTLHDSLLTSRPERLAHLLVRPDNPARLAYLKWGWQKVGTQQPFPDSPIFDEMIRVLPL